MNDIRPQVTDIEIRKTAGIEAGLSLKKAWDIMRGARIVSLPILEDEKLAGIITVSDIAYSDMDVYDNMILSKAGTSYKNIVETIDGEMIVGDLDGEFEEGHVLRIPIYKNERKTKKVLYNLIKIIEKLKIDTVVFSEKIMFNHHELYNQIYQALVENKENILNGRKLMNYMNYDIFEYILNLQKVDIKQEDIYFLIKKDPNLDMQFLLRFIENCKTVNIVTNDIDRFKKIQSNLYEKESILISVLNNKSKSLKRAKYIFNVNMTKEEIEKYKINREAFE